MPQQTKTIRVRTNKRRGKTRVWKNRRVKVTTKGKAKAAKPAKTEST